MIIQFLREQCHQKTKLYYHNFIINLKYVVGIWVLFENLKILK